MIFRQIEVGLMQNFCYLLGCGESKEAAIIDCGFEPEKLIKIANEEGVRITKILLTHVHYDHSGAADELAQKTGAQIFAHHSINAKKGKSPQHGAWIIPNDFSPLTDGMTVKVGNIKGKVICSPGHQNDHLLFRFDPYLFTGDTLFIGLIGRTDFADSDPNKMTETLNKIITLPDELIICPGHDYGLYKTRKLEYEKKDNPYLTRL